MRYVCVLGFGPDLKQHGRVTLASGRVIELTQDECALFDGRTDPERVVSGIIVSRAAVGVLGSAARAAGEGGQ